MKLTETNLCKKVNNSAAFEFFLVKAITGCCGGVEWSSG
jgi:hypothetical protein